MVRPWRSLHRVPRCSDIKLMASAEPSDTPAPLHAIKGDTVSILTRMAILIYPYLLRLGLPTGSLLRTILIRASFILIYWREVSKFQTLIPHVQKFDFGQAGGMFSKHAKSTHARTHDHMVSALSSPPFNSTRTRLRLAKHSTLTTKHEHQALKRSSTSECVHPCVSLFSLCLSRPPARQVAA